LLTLTLTLIQEFFLTSGGTTYLSPAHSPGIELIFKNQQASFSESQWRLIGQPNQPHQIPKAS
jgi:hypothetical protein